MLPLALFGLLTGGYLLDSAIQNRPVIGTIKALIQDPGNAQAVLAAQKRAPATTKIFAGFDNPGTTANGLLIGSSGGAPSESASAAIAFARSQIGKPYVWGATGPNSYDCSGLVQAAYKAAGISIPRTTAQMQVTLTRRVNRADLLPGDLVFPDFHHVQLYVGNNTVIEAPRKGLAVREVAMWGFNSARRVT